MSTATQPKTAKQAAVEVLRRAAEPMKASDIGKAVLKIKGVKLAGKTPLASIAAVLAVENKKADGLFVRTAPGTYGLRELPVPTRPAKPQSRQEES